MIAMLVAALVELQGPGGQVILVNPDHITNIRKPYFVDQGHFTKGTNCLVFTADGKYFATMQSCQAVRELIGR